MKRFTADDVVIELQRSRDNCGCSEYYQGVALGFLEALKIVRDNLIPQWQDEPDESGWYFVESMEDEDPCYLYYDEEKWKFLYIDRNIHGNDDVFVDELADRRVCPIGARPKP